jgi:predicted nuclease of predicted toxin-antitoxin system
MKLLFDQNISYRIVDKLINYFPDCKHTSQVGLTDCEDPEIYNFARKNGYLIVTFDSDFYDLSLINGIPPKIIWLRTGNLTTNEIVELLRKNFEVINDFILNPDQDLTCLQIEQE